MFNSQEILSLLPHQNKQKQTADKQNNNNNRKKMSLELLVIPKQ